MNVHCFRNSCDTTCVSLILKTADKKGKHYLIANVNVLFCNDTHIIPHQNEFLDLNHKSSEKGPPVPTGRDKSY